MNKVFGIKAFKDNYIWAIHDQDNKHVVVVDPGEAEPVLSYLHHEKLVLDAILITHHHLDHTGGVLGLLEHFPNILVYGPLNDHVTGATHLVKEGDQIALPHQKIIFEILDIPGHTHGHIAFLGQNMLFCGDTLFSVGCGKIFEGTAAQMYHSLEKLQKLPQSTQIYCGHEYTLNNIKFAHIVEPHNGPLEQRRQEVLLLKEKQKPSLPVSLASELKTNPFLRCSEANVIKAVERYWGQKFDDPISVFSHLRTWKDQV